jgi:hypothetical protein
MSNHLFIIVPGYHVSPLFVVEFEDSLKIEVYAVFILDDDMMIEWLTGRNPLEHTKDG